MLTREALDAIAKAIELVAPDHHFLVLVAAYDNPTKVGVISNLTKKQQPLLADAFVKGCAGLATGTALEIPLGTTH